jgi:hypothetical protein
MDDLKAFPVLCVAHGTAWLYNVFAGMVGGIEVQLEPSRDSAVP